MGKIKMKIKTEVTNAKWVCFAKVSVVNLRLQSKNNFKNKPWLDFKRKGNKCIL